MDLTPLILSAKLALVSTILLLLISLPVAYILVYKKIRGKFFIESLVGLPLVVPPTVLGFYLLILMGPKGFLGHGWSALTGSSLAFTFAGLVGASMVQGLPFAVHPIKAAFEKLDVRLLEMSYVLGLTPWQAFFKVIIPNTINGLIAAAILTFAHTMGEFGIILMVGGSIPGKTKVASIAVYEYVENLQYHEAAVMSLIMVAISYVILLAVNYLGRSKVSTP
ncbi:MAG: molybdate ABC transporter permease subunit [Deltaproteobacteria bacterium]|nr:molybdate ABC transporter permease subunit [Deltaproteobacteria bacterium]